VTSSNNPSARRPARGRPPLILLAALSALALLCQGCALKTDSRTASSPNGASGVDERPRGANVFDAFLEAEFAPADGFDFPFGDREGGGSYTDAATGRRHDGWYAATRFAEHYSLGIHPGEDWNGRGGGDTDLGQPVYSVANGRVRFAGHCGRLWGNVVIVEHVFYENHERRRVHSVYAHLLDIKTRAGAAVRRGQLIASIGQDPDKLFNAHLHLELRWDASLAPTYWPTSDGRDETWVREHYAEPSSFIRARRRLHVPQSEQTLVLVDQASYKMRLYSGGRLDGEYDVSFGQERGRKRLKGDNRTPQGMYFVTQKHRGQFDGPYGAYYGGHWIKINYPNPYDAAWGRAAGHLDARQEAAIAASWSKRAPTLEATPLGGGIGFHGWAEEWPDDGPRHLSWGCVVMHLSDIRQLYDRIPAGAMVVIL
jgi:murein DD-endopeptidase MepM/ murein hydrolase activator NlpD